MFSVRLFNISTNKFVSVHLECLIIFYLFICSIICLMTYLYLYQHKLREEKTKCWCSVSSYRWKLNVEHLLSDQFNVFKL